MQPTRQRDRLITLLLLVSGLPVATQAQVPCQQYVFDTSGGIPAASYSTSGGTNGPGSLSNQNGWIPNPANNPDQFMIAVSSAQSFSGTQSILVTGNGSDLRELTRELPVGCSTTNPPPDGNAGLISVRLRYKKGNVVPNSGVIVKPQVLDDAALPAVFGFFQIMGSGTMFGRGGVATTTVTDTFDPANYPGNGYPMNGWHELEMRLNPNHTTLPCDCVIDPATNTPIPFGNLLYVVNGHKVPGVNNPMAYYGGTNTSGKVGRLTFRREVGSNASTASAYFDSWEVWAHPRPVIKAQPITVTLNAAGGYTLTATDINNLTAGSIGGDQTQSITSRTVTPNTFNCSSANIGANPVTLTVLQTDGQRDPYFINGVATFVSNVTVLRPGPTVSCQPGTLSRALSNGVASFTVSDVKATSGPGSLCSSLTSEQIRKTGAPDSSYGSSVSFDCTELGEQSITLRVVQNDGQVQTCTRTVTITGATCPRSITAWRSVHTHNGSGELAIPLDAAADGGGPAGPSVETRIGGVRRIEIDFGGPVTLLDVNGVTCTGWPTTNGSVGAPAAYIPSQVVMLDADTMAVGFDPGVLPAQPGCLSISVGPQTLAESVAGDAECLVRTLAGDVSSDGSLNLTDVIFAMLKIGALESAAAHPALDVDLSGGDIAVGDMQQVKAGVSSPVTMALCP